MEKINFQNGQAPAINSTNLNQLQTNVEEAIVEVDNKNNYSTEETVIGTWVDGKPIYRKTIAISNIGKAGTVRVSNVKRVINFKGYLYSGDNVFPVNMPLGDYGHTATYFNNSTSNLHIDSSYNIENGYVILEYTKTTD